MDAGCERTRELAAELALGIVEGEERGRALEHLAACPECRAEVEKLSDVADELVLLAPHEEPPPGFESRVLSRIMPPAPRRRRWLRPVLAPAAAALAAAAIVLAIVAPDLRLASHYRDTLDEANGREFESYALRDAGDARAGTVFAYEGSPSWLHVDVDGDHAAGMARAELVTDDGDRIRLKWFQLDSGGGSGGSLPVDPGRVSVLRLSGAPGTKPLIARFGG